MNMKELANELDDLRARKDDDGEELDEDDTERLRDLEKLERDLGEDLHIFARNGGNLVSDRDQKRIAQDAFEDEHGRKAFSKWPFTAIDWDQATADYFTDWTVIEFEGETYYTQDVWS